MEILNPKEEQTVADDDTVQYQARHYLDEDVDNFDGGIYSNIKLSGAEYKKFQSEAITWHADKVGKVIHQIIGGNTYVYSFDADHNITVYNKYRATNIHERKSVIDDKLNRRTTDRSDDRRRGGGEFDTSDLLSSDSRTAGRSSGLSGTSLSDSRGSDGGRNAENAFSSDTEQFQHRSDTLTDRDILELAAREIVVDDLTPGEQDALRIFKERLDKFESLQIERAEQGRLYREQPFGTKVDREAVNATLDRGKYNGKAAQNECKINTKNRFFLLSCFIIIYSCTAIQISTSPPRITSTCKGACLFLQANLYENSPGKHLISGAVFYPIYILVVDVRT